MSGEVRISCVSLEYIWRIISTIVLSDELEKSYIFVLDSDEWLAVK